MGTKRYLIRKKDMTFTGPYSLNRLKKNHRQLDIFAADEIAAGFGKWVKIEDIARLKRHYPELVDLAKDFLSGWGVTASTIEEIEPLSKKKKTSILSGFFSKVALLLFLIVSGFLYFRSHEPETYQKMLTKIQLRSNHQSALESLEEKGSMTDLASYLQTNRDAVIKEAKRSKSKFKQMLKYLRVIAFQGNGSIDGISDTHFSGPIKSLSTPKICSQSSWKKRWTTSEPSLNSWVSGEKVSKEEWAKLLSWSPAWIKKRQDDDWIWPQNYHAACVLMAEKAYASISFDALDKQTYTMIKNRLSFMRSSLSNASTYTADEAKYDESFSYLNQLTCLEMAETTESMHDCSDAEASNPVFNQMLSFRKSWLHAGILIQKVSSGSGDDSFESLQATVENMEAVNDYIGLSYQQELHFLNKVVGSVPNEVMETIREELKVHPGVEYSH